MPDSYHAITPARVDICPPIVTRAVEDKHSTRILLFNMEGNQTSVIESSNSEIKKVMASAVPESTKVTSRLLIFSPT